MKSLYEVLHPEKTPGFSVTSDPLGLSTAENFAKGIVESHEYRASLERRILSDSLPSAVECRILDHALGKPVERMEIESVPSRFDGLTLEQLEQRVLFLGSLVRQLRVSSGIHRSSEVSDVDDVDVKSLILH